MGSRAPSPYHDLGRWESEQDLIQLDTSPHLRPSANGGSARRFMSNEGSEPRKNPTS